MTTTITNAPNAHADDPCAHWAHLIDEFQAVEAIPRDDVTDESIDLAGDLIGKIMAMPAPHNTALRWKLDYLLSTDWNGERSTGAYSADYVAQTVADYRRVLGNSDDAPSEFDRGPMTFEGLDLPFDHTNEDWALANLPKVRIASLLLRDNDVELTERVRGIAAEGLMPEMLDGIIDTKEHLVGIASVLDTALTRLFVALERLGYSPDKPPPDGTIQ